MVKEELLKILACPKCKEDLEEEAGSLKCTGCGSKFEVEEDIPKLMP